MKARAIVYEMQSYTKKSNTKVSIVNKSREKTIEHYAISLDCVSIKRQNLSFSCFFLNHYCTIKKPSVLDSFLYSYATSIYKCLHPFDFSLFIFLEAIHFLLIPAGPNIATNPLQSLSFRDKNKRPIMAFTSSLKCLF